MQLNGMLLIDKPKGWTSFDVVARVRSVVRTAARNQLSVVSDQKQQTTENRQQTTTSTKVRVGHTGTLDPLATGLLVLLLGKYTKRAPELTKLDKTYEVTMKLGFVSSTGDSEGEVKPFGSKKLSQGKPSRQKVENVLKEFVGEGLQVPPAYSAVKVGGQRAYKLARAGKTVELKARQIIVYRLEVIGYGYPEVKFLAEVSSGTYIRSLVEDIGNRLGTGAYMSDLRRTKVGQFDIKDAVSVESINLDIITNSLL